MSAAPGGGSPGCGGPDAGVSRLSDDAREYAYKLLANTREELVRADAKAALLLATGGIAGSALLNGLLGGRWTPFQLVNSVEWLWWIGLLSAVGAVLSLACGVYPRTRGKGIRPELASYYGDVVGISRDQLLFGIVQVNDHIDSALVDQIYQIAHIVERKYKCMRVAIWAFGAGAVLCTTSVLLGS